MNCTKCGQPGTFSRHHKICNPCRSDRNRERQNRNVRSYLDRLLIAARSRAKTQGIPCTITLDQLEALWKKQKGRCAISKIAMTHSAGGRKARDFNVSIDQITAGAGYTPQNVQLVCCRINMMKNVLDATDFSWWIRTLYAAMEG